MPFPEAVKDCDDFMIYIECADRQAENNIPQSISSKVNHIFTNHKENTMTYQMM